MARPRARFRTVSGLCIVCDPFTLLAHLRSVYFTEAPVPRQGGEPTGVGEQVVPLSHVCLAFEELGQRRHAVRVVLHKELGLFLGAVGLDVGLDLTNLDTVVVIDLEAFNVEGQNDSHV